MAHAHKMPVFSGGIPTHSDIVPTVIFLVIFLLLTFLVIRNLILIPSRRAVFFAHRPLVHALVGRIPYLVLRLVQATGTGRSTNGINVTQGIEITIGHFALLYTIVDVITAIGSRLHGKKGAEWGGLVGLIFSLTLIAATVGGFIDGIWWSSARKGNFKKQDGILKLRRLSTIAPFDVCCIFLLNTLIIMHERKRQLAGKKATFKWLVFSNKSDLTKIPAEAFHFILWLIVPMFILTLYRVIVASFVLEPTPQDPESYPIPIDNFLATPRSNGLFYTLQLATECVAMSAYCMFDLREIFGVEGKWGWKVKKGEERRENLSELEETAARVRS